MPQLKNKKIYIYIFLFLLFGSINNKSLINFNFAKINNINIEGLDEKNNSELFKKLDFLNIGNLFFLDKEKVSEIINSNNLVEKYSVFKNYPSTLNVKITKAKFLAKIKNNGKDFFLGSNGKLIKDNSYDQVLPQIFGKFKNENFFELKKAIDQSKFEYKEIKNLFFYKSNRWDIETNSGLLIKLPIKDIEKSLKMVSNFLDNNPQKKIYKIDLRQKNQVIINE